MKKYLVILFLLISYTLSATNYYVKNGGNDEASGLDDDNAWATMAKVQATISGGDSVFFNRGDTWREAIDIQVSGTSGAYTYFGSYGSGADPQPEFLGSTALVTWTETGTANVWESATSVTDPYDTDNNYDAEIFFNETGTIIWGHIKKTYVDLSELTEEYDWTWNDNTIYVYAATDPDARYTSVDAPQLSTAFKFNQQDYIHMDSLDIHYYIVGGTGENYVLDCGTGVIVENCHISHIGKKNSGAAFGVFCAHSDVIIRNNEIHDAGRRNISIYANYPEQTFDNVLIDGNTLYNGWHTTGVDLAASGANTVISDVTISNNLIYDDSSLVVTDTENPTSLGMFIFGRGHPSDGELYNTLIYNNIIKGTRSRGISIDGADTVGIYNNTFYGFNDNATYAMYQLNIDNNPTFITLRNNIFWGDALSGVSSQARLVYLSAGADNDDVDADYNLYYQKDAAIHVIVESSVGGYYMDEIADLRTDWGWETNGQFIEPLFADLSTGDLTPKIGSPAIGAGIGVGILKDYNGDYHNDPPDIGAIAYDPVEPAPPELPIVTTWVNNHSAVYATVTGYVLDDGGGAVTVRGICYGPTANPTTANRVIKSGDGEGEYIVHIPIAGGTWHIRAFATNETGTSYGGDWEVSALSNVVGTYGDYVGTINGKLVKF